jgi:hypothetical protein
MTAHEVDLMIRLTTSFFGLLAALLCAAHSARGAVLFERSLVVDRSVNIYTTTEFDLQFELHGGSALRPTDVESLLPAVQISPSSAGQTFVADASNTPDFETIAARLSDAINENVRLLFTESASDRVEKRGWTERGFFLRSSLTEAPDLAGALVTSITVRIDQFTLAFGGGGGGTSAVTPPVELLLTFSVLGQPVPEPATFGLASGGLLAAIGAAYTRAQRRRLARRAR